MKTMHYFAVLKKSSKRVKLIELVENTPKKWKDIEYRRLVKEYHLGSSKKYDLLEFYTYNIENYIPYLLREDYKKKRYHNEEVI